MKANLLQKITLIVMALLSFPGESAASEDWPMWRADANRSAASQNSLPAEFELLWTKQFPARVQAWDDPLNLDLMTYDRIFEPIVLDGKFIVGFNDQDKVVALDASTGESLWTFYTEAPVRLPPVGWHGKAYFCSDDGFLYCVDVSNGKLIWKFCGAPNSQHAIGNRRLTSAWPARGGPVIYDEKVYFAASIWPFMGTFLYALDAETGAVDWVNDHTGAQYIKQPHSAPSFAGVAPQGAIVATEELLVVPGGRSVPAVFDRRTGDLKYFEINAGGKGTGGSFVSADERHFYVHTREKGTRAFNLATGLKTAFTPNEPVSSGGFLYSAEDVDGKPCIRCYDASDDSNVAREPVWQLPVSGRGDLILVGENLLAVGDGVLTVIPLPDETADTSSIVASASIAVSEKIARVLVANKRVFLVSSDGGVSALGSKRSQSIARNERLNESETPILASVTRDAEQLLGLGDAEGYAFWYGNAADERIRALARISPFAQLAVVDSHDNRVDELRRDLDHLGVYGSVTAHVANASDFRAPNYVANMVFVSEAVANDGLALSAIYESVRPYGGVMVVLTDAVDAAKDRIAELDLEKAVIEPAEVGVVVRRVGALPGAADWTHQYGNVANTIKSDDSRVKLPLGILWFGGSSNMDVLPRHGHGPPEQVVGGRLFIQGMNSLSARDVYTGRVLWKREFEDLGTFDVYYDSTYENTPLNPKYNQVHIPGANGRGTNYVVTEDVVYILDGEKCLMLDPKSGKTVGEVVMPANEDGSVPEWGYLGVFQDVLLGGVGFAETRKRFDLNFESDSKLKSSRAGYGSKSFDRAASRGLIAFDRHSGEQLWRVDANHSFWHNGIVAGSGRVFCLDKHPTQIEEAMRRRGLSLPESYRILCLDVLTGQVAWDINEGVFGTWLGYSEEFDLLLQAGAQGSDRLYAEVGQGMRVYQAKTGELQWKNDSLKYAGPCILHHDLILTNANSYSESAGAFYLKTGQQRMVKHPLTGAIQPWKMTRAYGCNNIIASENLLTFRSGAAGYYDLLSNSGTGNLGGFKSGCTSNLVVANGVLNAPDYTRTCSCSYQNQTSLALVHMPEIEMWSVNSLAQVDATQSQQVTSMGVNFGAPGDRRDEDGTLWLEYPIVAGVSPTLSIETNAEARFFKQHSSVMASAEKAWIASSGIENVTELRLSLELFEAPSLAEGLPVARAEDDGEEDAAGQVSLDSSDLELVHDDTDQLVGMRFTNVELEKDAVIREAYIQFTCDETSQEPTSLMVHGELAANAESFAEDDHDLSSRQKTANDVAWTPEAWNVPGESALAQRTPDLSRLVQEMVAQTGWRSGNSMAFFVSGTGKRTANSSRGDGKDAPKLIVVADASDSAELEELAAQDVFDVELICANPRGYAEPREFEVRANDSAVAKVHLNPGTARDASEVVVVRLPNVSVGNHLNLRFHPTLGTPVVCGIRVTRVDSNLLQSE